MLLYGCTGLLFFYCFWQDVLSLFSMGFAKWKKNPGAMILAWINLVSFLFYSWSAFQSFGANLGISTFSTIIEKRHFLWAGTAPMHDIYHVQTERAVRGTHTYKTLHGGRVFYDCVWLPCDRIIPSGNRFYFSNFFFLVVCRVHEGHVGIQ